MRKKRWGRGISLSCVINLWNTTDGVASKADSAVGGMRTIKVGCSWLNLKRDFDCE